VRSLCDTRRMLMVQYEMSRVLAVSVSLTLLVTGVARSQDAGPGRLRAGAAKGDFTPKTPTRPTATSRFK